VHHCDPGVGDCWPDHEERLDIKRRIRRESGFPSCLGFVDGTLFVLENKPLLDGEDCFSRKGRYGLAGLIVCDDPKRIRYVYSGWPGCSHDARVFENSMLARQPHQFFDGNEYLLADSGYTPCIQIIPAFKRPQNRGLGMEESQFNLQLSKIRVRVEHCIGILKGRFQSLKGLRTIIRRKRDVRRLTYWIRACCVLHNLVLQDPVKQEWLEDDDEGDDDGEIQIEGDETSVVPRETAGKKKRRDLIPFVLSKFQ
jgi:DDE superfamily endonuclease